MYQKLGIVLGICLTIYGDIPYPTGFGTKPCKKWPNFYLQDYNPFSRASFLQTYSLNEMSSAADATVVGLYFADSENSIEAIKLQDRISYALMDEYNITVQNVAINYFAPKECAKLECIPVWTLENEWWYFTSSCDGYIGGCPPGDERLQVDNWQGKLASVADMPIFQDTYWVDAWERFGGGEGDIFIYDKAGRLYSVFCTVEDFESMPLCGNIYKGGGMLTEDSYTDLKNVVLNAAQSDSATRCTSFDDFYYQGYATYYSTDDDKDDDDDDNDDDDDDDDDDDENKSASGLVNPNPNPHDDDNDNQDGSDDKAEDDDCDDYFDDDDDDDDGPTNRFNLGFHNHHKLSIRKTIPSWGLALFGLTIVGLLLGCVGVCRWRRLRSMNVMASRAHSGATKFSRLSTIDEDIEYVGDVEGSMQDAEDSRRTAQGQVFVEHGNTYGSL